MVTLGPGEKLAGGVPLGGIGAGKVEIDNKGKMVNLSIANNWGFPTRWMRGFHIFIRPDDSEPFFAEYGVPIKTFYRYEPGSMTYTGRYPFAIIKARKGGVEATVEAFSPIIPNNLADSALPVFGLSVKVEGSESGSVTVAASNMAGTLATGRLNVPVTDGVKFTNPRSNEYDGARGELCLLASTTSERYTQYNLNVRPAVAISERHWKYTLESAQPWLSMIKKERFGDDDQHEVRGQWDDPAGAVTSLYTRGSEARYAFSWYFTGRWVLYPYGHYYHTKFGSAEEVGRYMLKEFDRLRRQSYAWHEDLVRKDLPEWLRDAVINSTYILSASTILDERGRFAIFEATKSDPMLGTISAFCHECGSLPVLKMFPELEKRFLELLSGYAREDGYIPHDVGIHSLDHPTDGTTSPPDWKDLTSSFVLLVYRYARWTNDSEFLRLMYPKMTKAIEWTLKQDKDGDGIPDLEGDADSGFDATSITGRDSYCASLFVAALAAMRESSKLLGRHEEAESTSKLLSKARESFAEMYNGRYFEAWNGEPSCRGYIFTGQMAGDWWTSTLGLEPIAAKEKIDSTYNELLNVNAQASRFCTPNMVHESGRIWEISAQAYSSMPRVVFSLAGVRYRAGDERWLEVAEKEWSNLIAQGLVWDHPSRIDGRSGKPDPEATYLDHYIGSPAVWTFNL